MKIQLNSQGVVRDGLERSPDVPDPLEDLILAARHPPFREVQDGGEEIEDAATG